MNFPYRKIQLPPLDTDNAIEMNLFDMPAEIIDKISHSIFPDDISLGNSAKITLCLTCKSLFAAIYGDLDMNLKSNYLEDYYIACNNIEAYSRICPPRAITYHHCVVAVKYGSTHIIEFIGTHDSSRLTDDFIGKLFEYGHLPAIITLHQTGRIKIPGKYANHAALNGHIHILEWLHDKHIPYGTTLVRNAAEHGFNTLKWCIEHGYPHNNTILEKSLMFGHVDCVNYCAELGYTKLDDGYYANIYTNNTLNGNLDMLKLTYSLGCVNVAPRITEIAAHYGHLNILQWLKEIGQFYPDNAIDGAIKGGNVALLHDLCDDIPKMSLPSWIFTDRHIDMIDVLFRAGGIVDHTYIVSAARGGHWNIIKWAINNGFECFTVTCATIAATKGYVPFLAWLVDRGYVLSGGLIVAAAKYGNNNTIKWLREQGCPWDIRAPEKAARHKWVRTFRLLIEWGCPFDPYRVYKKSRSKYVSDWIVGSGHFRKEYTMQD